MNPSKHKKLGEILIEDGSLTRAQVQDALAHQKQEGGMIGQVLVRMGLITEENLVAALGKQLGVPYLPVENYSINLDTLKELNERFCRENFILPLDQDEKRIFITVGDPLNDDAIRAVEQQTRLKAQVFISTPSEIQNMLDLIFRQKGTPNPIKKAA